MSKKGAKRAPAAPPPALRCSQALVLAENFGLGPVNFCLEPCPLEPPLKKVLQLLDQHDLLDVFVFTAEQERVAAALELSGRRWRCPAKLIYSENCSSVGDVLREVHRMGIIHSDFLLIAGNVLSEIPLRQYIRTFEERAERSRTIAMKFFVREERHTPERLREHNFVAVERSNSVLRFWDHVPPGEVSVMREHCQFSFRQAAGSLDLHFGLEDAGLTLCSLDVFNVYSEHFEFASEQDDFIRDVTSSDIPDEQVLAVVLPDDAFHMRVNNSYKLLRAAMLQLKHCFGSLVLDRAQFVMRLRDNQIISRKARIDDSHVMGLNVFVDAEAVIGANTHLRNAFISEKCVIGRDCRITNTFLAAGVVVPDDTVLDGVCWFGADEGERRTLRAETAPRSRRNSLFYADEPLEERRPAHPDTLISREEFFAFVSALERPGNRFHACALREGLVAGWGAAPVGLLDEEEEYERCSEDEEVAEAHLAEARVRDCLAKLTADMSNINAVRVNLVNIRLAENRSFSEMISVIGQEILAKLAAEPDRLVREETCQRLRPLLEPFIADEEDRWTLLLLAERYCRGNPALGFPFLMQLLLKLGMIDEAAALAWRRAAAAEPDDFRTQAMARLERFFAWLAEEEEDDD